MPHYLLQMAYTPEAWAAQLRNPQNRLELVRPAAERIGARLETAYFCYGEYDLIAIVEAPDNETAAGLAMAFAAGGAIKAAKTTPLLDIEEGLEAMRKGAEVAALYRPPTG